MASRHLCRMYLDINHICAWLLHKKWRRSEIIFAIEHHGNRWIAPYRDLSWDTSKNFFSAASDRFNFFTLVIERLNLINIVCNGSPLGKFDIVRMRFFIIQFCNCRPSAEGRPNNKHIRINYNVLLAAKQFSRCPSDKISAGLFLKFIALY